MGNIEAAVIVDKRRRAGVGAEVSGSESRALTGRCERRTERGVWCLCGEMGDEGGERACLAVRVAGFFASRVGVKSRLERWRVGEPWSW